MSKKTTTLLVIFFVAFSFFISFKTKAANFDPNNIISDEEMLDYQSMSLKDIQNFLKSRGSYLANYSCPNADGVTKTAAEIIYEASTDNYDCDEAIGLSSKPTIQEKREKCQFVKMNPQFILVLLQKEQSLIEDATPKQSQLDWALGYGCPDGQSCYERWRGLGKQINSAILQFYDYMKHPQRYKYQVGQSYTVTNTGRPSQIVTPANRATAGLYNYTPHVYNGNFNFYKIWKRYFTRDYPNGSLLQAKGEVGVWLIQNGYKRAFKTRSALTSRFDVKKIISVNKSILDNYPTGKPIMFAQYSIVSTPKGGIYLLVDDKKRPFVNMAAFRKIGINPGEIIKVELADLDSYTDGDPITVDTAYPTGALLQNKKTGGVYWVSDNTKAPVIDRLLLKTRFKFKSIHPVDPKILDKYQTVQPALYSDGELLKTNEGTGVYVIENGLKRPFASGEIFESMGYKWTNVLTISSKLMNLYLDGLPIVGVPVVIDVNVDTTASSTDSVASSTSPVASSTDAVASTTETIASTTPKVVVPYTPNVIP